jgi:hypothetical protein
VSETVLRCPGCDRRLDDKSVGPSRNRAWVDGEAAVCLSCGTIFTCGVGVVLLRATPEHLRTLDRDEQEALAAMAATVHVNNRPPSTLVDLAAELDDLSRRVHAAAQTARLLAGQYPG